MNVLDKFSMKNKVSIVTGAAQGLGKAMAGALAQAGSNIVISEINLPLAQKSAKELEEKYGIETLVVCCDVTSSEDVQNMVKATIDKFGKIDVLINNAGICKHIPVELVSIDDWLAVINVNLNGVFLCAQAAGKVMIKQNFGNIINISSMSGVVVNTPQCQAAYNSSKAGVIMLTKSLASEWAKYNIRVNTIAPGYMNIGVAEKFFKEKNDMVKRWLSLIPMGRPGEPEELGGIAVYLASDASSYVTGGVFLVDGGYTIW